ncbi:Collagen alpha-1(XIV) chain, partial [Lamellibrachia satsuma]
MTTHNIRLKEVIVNSDSRAVHTITLDVVGCSLIVGAKAGFCQEKHHKRYNARMMKCRGAQWWLLAALLLACFNNTDALAGECSNFRADIVFVMDSSISVGIDNWNKLLDFMLRVVDNLYTDTADVRIGAVRFSSNAVSVFHLNTYSDKNSLENGIRQMTYDYGWTNTVAGINVMHNSGFKPENGDRTDAQNIAIIVTDGRSYDYNDTISSAEAARRDSIHIYSIGVTSNINEKEVSGMASEPKLKNKNYYLATDFNSLTAVADALVSTACNTSGKITQKSVWVITLLY